MAFITADRVLDSSTSTGTGAFVVSGTPAAGYRTFSAVMSVGDTCYYSIQGQTTSEWEVGLGTYSSANTLTRTTVYSSSNSGSAVTFSAGTKNVFITMVASKSPQLDPTGNVTALGTLASATLTNATGLSLTTGVTGVLPAANGGSLAWQSVQSASFAAVAGNAYPVNTTSGAVTVTLPASPSAGQIVQITDYAGTFATNACTVNPNGGKIRGSTSNFPLSAPRESVALIYVDSTQGWAFISGIIPASVYSASYLVVAGGGGAGYSTAGAGGAGGFLTGTATLTSGAVYTATVGAGGSGSAGVGNTNTAGVNSSLSGSGITTVTSVGGGKGADGGVNNAGAGGSGGGGGGGVTGAGGAATSGQGFAGGTGSATPNFGSGGGGGASAVGSNGSGNNGGNGGAGLASSITGSSVTYAGGGGGGSNSNATAGTGGAGGGGNGGASSNAAGSPGTANTGGGGGGGRNNTVATDGGAGGSGVVILSIPASSYSGTTTGSPTVTTTAGYVILKFTASGSYTA